LGGGSIALRVAKYEKLPAYWRKLLSGSRMTYARSADGKRLTMLPSLCAATVQQPHQDGAVLSRNEKAYNRPISAYLSHRTGRVRIHSESPQRLCTAEVRGSNPLGSTRKSRALQGKYHDVEKGRKIERPRIFGGVHKDALLSFRRNYEMMRKFTEQRSETVV
jgi:hypothetical protein